MNDPHDARPNAIPVAIPVAIRVWIRDAVRAHHGPPPGVRESNRRAIARSIADGTGPRLRRFVPAPSTRSSITTTAGWTVAFAVAAALLVVAWWSPTPGGAHRDTDSAPALAPMDRDTGPDRAHPTLTPERHPVPSPRAEPETPAPGPTPVDPRATRRPARPRSTSTAPDQDELAALRDLGRAFDRNDDDAVLRGVARYRERFVGGALAEEVDALQVLASCRAGHRDAPARADAFTGRYPTSIHRGRIADLCGT
jgi:hypothetical protein